MQVSTPFFFRMWTMTRGRLFLCVSVVECHPVVAVHRSFDGLKTAVDIPPNFGRTQFRVDTELSLVLACSWSRSELQSELFFFFPGRHVSVNSGNSSEAPDCVRWSACASLRTQR